MSKKNYHKLMMSEIEDFKDMDQKPRLLIHSCCAPCSSYVLELLSLYFEIEVLFFNPNIYPEEEYSKRLDEQMRLVDEMGLSFRVTGSEIESELFYDAVEGYEHLGEMSERCMKCFRLRLERAAQYAKSNDFDYFTTTLTISPLKNASALNDIGTELEDEHGVKFLPSDFKKNNGYRRSVELSEEHGLYRQNYCGCVFSKKESEDKVKNTGE